MTVEAKKVLEKALRLTRKQRAMIASEIIKSMEKDEVEKAWQEEIERRIELYNKGLSKSVSWQEVSRKMARMIHDKQRSQVPS
jgi:putative addiction module component (TIGR02574 family)